MPRFKFHLLARLTTASLLVAFLFGCSASSQKTLEKADAYFTAGEYENAEIEYKNVLQKEGLNPRAIARLGMIYLDQGRLARAASFLGKANELEPENIEVKLKLGYLYLGMNRMSDARDAAVFVLDRKPQDPEAPILLAESITNPNEAAAARARLEKLPPPAPEGAPVLTALGLLELRQRKVDAAFALLERANKADPKFGAAAVSLGRVYWARKDLAQAENLFKTAAEQSPLRSPLRLQQVQFNLQNGRVDEAKRLLAEMNAKVPDFLPAYLLLANIAATEKRYEESIGWLEKLLTREPLHPEALLLTAQVRMANGENDKALVILERAVAAYPKSPHVHYQLGLVHVARGDLPAAATSLSEAVNLAPGLAPAVLALSQVNIRQQNFGPAVESLTAFLQQNPASGEAQLLLAEAYRNQGNLDGALAIYRKLTESNPKNGQVQLLIGTILIQQNKKDEAHAALTKAADLSPDSLPALEQLVNLELVDKKYDSARARIESYIAKNPGNAASHLILAKTYILEGNAERAEAALQKTIELKPDSAVPYSLLAEHYIKTNQEEKALAALQAAAAKNPGDTKPFMQLGVLYEQKKDYAAARESYEKVIALDPKAAAALNNLAFIYAEHFGELEKAQEMAQKARDLPPEATANTPAKRDIWHGSTADTLGWILYKRGQYARAVAVLEESAEKLPDHPEARFHLGMARYMMGDEEGARAALERALELNKTFSGADEARQRLAILAIDAAKSGEKERAILDQTIANHKDDPVALSRLATLHERQGSADKARIAYETAVNANPSNTSAALNLIRLYRAGGEKAKALELARATRRLVPADGRIAHQLGRLAFESGEHLSAVGVLQEAARSQSGDPEVLFDLAEASYSVGRVSAAEDALREALAAKREFSRAVKAREYLELIEMAQKPSAAAGTLSKIEGALRSDETNLPAIIAKAALDEQKGDIKAAKQSYEKALSRFPDFTPAKRQLTILYAAHPEDDKKAAELAAKAREAFSTDPEVAKAFGVILYRQGNYTRAASLLQESARNRSSDAEVMYYLGMSQHQLKDEAASTRSLQRALDLKLPEKLAADARRVLAVAK